jgi:hypothetical protein
MVEARRGSLTADFDLFLVNHDAAAGTIRVGLGRSAGSVADRGPGSVLLLTFRIRENAPSGRAVINLRRGLGLAATQLNEGGLELNPAPSDRAGDALDGVITVQPRARQQRLEAVRDRVFSSAAVLPSRRVADMVQEFFRAAPPADRDISSLLEHLARRKQRSSI